MSEPASGHECPFCLERVGAVVIVVSALRVFELHLDRHMERGDALAVAS